MEESNVKGMDNLMWLYKRNLYKYIVRWRVAIKDVGTLAYTKMYREDGTGALSYTKGNK